MIGAGFAADIHARAYHRIHDIDVKVVGVAASSPPSAEAFAARHAIPESYAQAGALVE